MADPAARISERRIDFTGCPCRLAWTKAGINLAWSSPSPFSARTRDGKFWITMKKRLHRCNNNERVKGLASGGKKFSIETNVACNDQVNWLQAASYRPIFSTRFVDSTTLPHLLHPYCTLDADYSRVATYATQPSRGARNLCFLVSRWVEGSGTPARVKDRSMFG